MLDKKVLFIGANSTFIVNAIKDGLKESGFECGFCTLDVAEISKIHEKPPIIIIYVDDKAAQETEALIYIRDICTEEEKLIFLILLA